MIAQSPLASGPLKTPMDAILGWSPCAVRSIYHEIPYQYDYCRMWVLSVHASYLWILVWKRNRFPVTTPLRWELHRYCLCKWRQVMPPLPMVAIESSPISSSGLKMPLARWFTKPSLNMPVFHVLMIRMRIMSHNPKKLKNSKMGTLRKSPIKLWMMQLLLLKPKLQLQTLIKQAKPTVTIVRHNVF